MPGRAFLLFGRLTMAFALAATVAACGAGSNPKLPAPGSIDADKFLYERGTFYLGKKNWLTAREYFTRLVDTYPRSAYRESAKLGIGDAYLGEGRIDSIILGENEYREFLQFFPLNAKADYARYKICFAASKQMLGPQRDQTATREAIKECDTFVRAFPTSPYRAEVDQIARRARDQLSDSEFQVGVKSYFRNRWYPGAIGRLQALLVDDPDYSHKDGVLYYLGESFYRGGRNPEALPYFERLVTEFPKSEYTAKAQARIAEIKR